MLSREEAENKILANANVEISPKDQQTLNKPLGHPGGLSKDDAEFLALLMSKIDRKEIDLYQPNTLLNHAVYNALNEGAKAKAELDAFNMLATIREIKKLWDAKLSNTYQMENLVHKMRTTKERLEEAGGDIFII
jgi:hypothetical protein